MPAKKNDLNDSELIKWRAKGHYMALCEHSIFVIDDASSMVDVDNELPVLLLVHGFPTSSWDWAPIWDSLAKHYRLVCLDMLGFGFSDKPNQRNYTIHKQADLIDELVTKLGLTEFHVLAHDYGVTVAQELLARQIDLEQNVANDKNGRWLSCTFLNGGLFPETHQALVIQKLLLSPLGKYLNAVTRFPQFATSFSKVFGAQTKPSDAELQQFWEVINFNNGRHVFHNLITYMNDRKQHRERWVNALQASPIPLALINGSIDPVSGQHLVVRYKELNCRLDHLDELTDIGHYPQVEAPDRVSQSVLTFLATIT